MNSAQASLPNGTVDSNVFTGFWINQSLGSFRGATLTLDQSSGGLVISFITLFIATTANSVWKLTRFALHMRCASPRSRRDGVYHQRQAILRNMAIATDAVMQSLRLGHVWRHRAQRPWRRAMLIVLAASTVSIISTSSGVLSPIYLKGSSKEVLLAGAGCGLLPYGSANLSLIYNPMMTYLTQTAVNDLTYASQCYQQQQADHCERFTQPELRHTSDKNASCPFASEICKLNSGNFLLDSGDVDSRDDLGLNKGPRFTLSYRTHCAPILSEGYTEVHRPAYFDRPLRTYKYGTDDGWDYVYERVDYNKTYQASVVMLTRGGTYRISTVSSFEKHITLIPQLMQSHDAVSLIFLDASEVVYFNRTKDPWFSASTPILPDEDESASFFLADEPTSVVACAAQRLFCNPSMPKASRCINTLRKSNESILSNGHLSRLWPSFQDRLFMLPLIVAMSERGRGILPALYEVPGADPLLSRRSMMGNGQAGQLPSDRWQAELERVYRASLAGMQSSVVEYARGFWGGNKDCTSEFPCQRMCKIQRVRSSKFYSFSTWTLVTILSVGSLIMTIAFYVEELFGLLLRRTSLGKRRRLIRALAAWQAESTLQLQRMAHEAVGIDSWKRTEEAIPVTRKGKLLGVYDTSDPKHARLVKPTSSTSSINSTSTGSISSNTNPKSVSNTNPHTASTFNLSLPALNFSDLSLPTTFSTEANHVFAPVSHTAAPNAGFENTALESNGQYNTDFGASSLLTTSLHATGLHGAGPNNTVLRHIGSQSTDHNSPDLDDLDVDDTGLNATNYNTTDLSDTNNTSLNNSTTSLLTATYPQGSHAAAGSSIRYHYGDISDDNWSDNEITQHRLSDDSIPLSALSRTRSAEQYTRLQG